MSDLGLHYFAMSKHKPKSKLVLCLTLCHFDLVFSVLLALRLPCSGKRRLILVLFVRLFDLRLFGFVCFLFFCCLGRAAVCDCGTPWTFLLFFCYSQTLPSSLFMQFAFEPNIYSTFNKPLLYVKHGENSLWAILSISCGINL